VKTCPECNGDGVIEKGTNDEQQCPTCGGSGFVPDDDDDDDDDEVVRTAVTQSVRSKADIIGCLTHVRFTPESGH
jgi:RecJ-like exonuclease